MTTIRPGADASGADKAHFVEKSLTKITKVLLGDDEGQRTVALGALRAAPLPLVVELVDRLVTKLEKGNAEVARRAHDALVVAGRDAVPTLTVAGFTTRKPAVQLRVLAALAAIAAGATGNARAATLSCLVGLFTAALDAPVRFAIMAALGALKDAEISPRSDG